MAKKRKLNLANPREITPSSLAFASDFSARIENLPLEGVETEAVKEFSLFNKRTIPVEFFGHNFLSGMSWYGINCLQSNVKKKMRSYFGLGRNMHEQILNNNFGFVVQPNVKGIKTLNQYSPLALLIKTKLTDIKDYFIDSREVIDAYQDIDNGDDGGFNESADQYDIIEYADFFCISAKGRNYLLAFDCMNGDIIDAFDLSFDIHDSDYIKDFITKELVKTANVFNSQIKANFYSISKEEIESSEIYTKKIVSKISNNFTKKQRKFRFIFLTFLTCVIFVSFTSYIYYKYTSDKTIQAKKREERAQMAEKRRLKKEKEMKATELAGANFILGHVVSPNYYELMTGVATHLSSLPWVINSNVKNTSWDFANWTCQTGINSTYDKSIVTCNIYYNGEPFADVGVLDNAIKNTNLGDDFILVKEYKSNIAKLTFKFNTGVSKYSLEDRLNNNIAIGEFQTFKAKAKLRGYEVSYKDMHKYQVEDKKTQAGLKVVGEDESGYIQFLLQSRIGKLYQIKRLGGVNNNAHLFNITYKPELDLPKNTHITSISGEGMNITINGEYNYVK